MSHALSSRKTGKLTTHGRLNDASVQEKADASMFYVKRDERDVPWHGLGQAVDHCLTTEEAINAAGLNWGVELGDVYDADMQLIKGYRRTYRTDNGYTLGIVGTRYTIIDNLRGFEIADGIIGDGKAKFDTAGALYDGGTVWINAILPNSITIAGEEVKPYFLLRLSHDGTSSLILQLTPIRTVCQNTLNMAIQINAKQSVNKQHIRHTANYEERVKEAQRIMGFTNDYYTKFEETANGLVAVKFSEKNFEELMNEICPLPDDNASKRAFTLAENQRQAIIDCYNQDDLNNIRDTAWGAYNAIADYSDHGRGLRGDNKEANAFIRTFENTTLKDRALELLLAK